MRKTILVTGSTGAIGLAISEHFYRKGYNVVITGKCKPSQLKNIKKNFLKDRALYLIKDLTKSSNIKKIIRQTILKFKTIDVKGLSFNPLTKKWKRDDNLSVNYIICSLKC